MDGADGSLDSPAAEDWSEIAQAEYERVTRLGATPDVMLYFYVATFPLERMDEARALVEDLWELGEAAGIADHHVYPMLQNGQIHVVLGPSENMMGLMRKQQMVFDLGFRFGVMFMLRPLYLQAPDRSSGAADTRIPLP
jgi:hypothetical protein